MFSLFRNNLPVHFIRNWKGRFSSINQSNNSKFKLLSKENIPPTALIISTIALCFQISVLYPWHEVLSEQFVVLEEQFKLLKNATHTIQEYAIDLDKKMDKVVQLEEEVKVKERKVLDREEDILNLERNILTKILELDEKLDKLSTDKKTIK